MTQEEKDLLLKDLCGRLPYNVKVRVTPLPSPEFEHLWYDAKMFNINTNNIIGVITDDNVKYIPQDVETIKPYLFPLSSMTDAQEDEWYKLYVQPLFDRLGVNNRKDDLMLQAKSLYIGIDWLNANHFDYRGLIPAGLAEDATGLNIYNIL